MEDAAAGAVTRAERGRTTHPTGIVHGTDDGAYVVPGRPAVVDLDVDPRRAAVVLGTVLALLAATGTVLELLWVEKVPVPGLSMLVRWFWMDLEANVPTWFSSVVLVVGALLALSVAGALRSRPELGAARRWSGHWRLLGVAFVYLSLDELAQFHDQVDGPLQKVLGTGRDLPFAWVLLALPLVAAFGLYYVRFLLALPPRYRYGLVVAGALYVGGAAGVELVGGLVWSQIGPDTVLYTLVTAVEETLEMVGASLLVVVVAAYRRSLRG